MPGEELARIHLCVTSNQGVGNLNKPAAVGCGGYHRMSTPAQHTVQARNGIIAIVFVIRDLHERVILILYIISNRSGAARVCLGEMVRESLLG